MLQQSFQEPIVFRTRDGLLTFTFTLGEDPSGSHAAAMVTAEIALSCETSAPATHGPITVAIYQDGPTRLAHSAGDSAAGGHTLAGTLALQPQAHQQIDIVADLFYGERGGHHLAGVVGSFAAPACHAPAWVLCGCSGSAPRYVTGDVTGDIIGHVTG
jgi:hypothetical protein